jgi:hypothetical protein
MNWQTFFSSIDWQTFISSAVSTLGRTAAGAWWLGRQLGVGPKAPIKTGKG